MELLYTLFGYVMKFCGMISGNNYLLALFFFTLIVQILLFPLGIKQQKNSIKTASLRPKEQAIRKKYAGRNDKSTQQKMNKEIQELYQQEGYNAMSGCLPLLIQFPIIMILYAIVRLPLKYSVDVPNEVKQEIVNQSTIVATNQLSVLEVYGEKGDEYKEIVKFINTLGNPKLGDESGALKSLKYTSKPFIEKYLNGGYKQLAEKDYLKYLKISNVFGKYNTVYVPGTDTAEVKREQISIDTLNNANTLEMYSFGYESSLVQNSVEKELGFKDLLEARDIDIENDIPNFKFIGETTLLDIPNIGTLSILLLIPVLVFVTSFGGAEISRKFAAPVPSADGQNPGNNLLLRVGMPLISVWISFGLPAALGMYWIYRSILSAIQQIILSKMYPLPSFTKEELKAAEEEVMRKRKKKKIIMIEVDEDDTSYDSLIISEEKAERIRKRHEKAASENTDAKSSGAKSEKIFVDRAPMKKDDDSEVK